MCLTAYFLEVRQRDGENTPLLYISAWKREGKCGRKEAEKRVFWAEKAWMQAEKREEIKRKIFLQD